MGNKNPIAELVVAPNIVIASPILGIAREIAKLIVTRIKVQMTFYLDVSFYPGFKKSSSIVSLQGRIVRGVAKRITMRIPKRETKLAGLFG